MISMMVMRCPSTGETVMTGILVSSETFNELLQNGSQIRCPVCRQIHSWGEDTRLSMVNANDTVLRVRPPVGSNLDSD